MSAEARNIPVDSIMTTTIATSVMVPIRTASKVGGPKANGRTSANHGALATFSKVISPIATAAAQPVIAPSSTAMLATKPRRYRTISISTTSTQHATARWSSAA